jgi:hypothetical protein
MCVCVYRVLREEKIYMDLWRIDQLVESLVNVQRHNIPNLNLTKR